jgi:hypothetical protein
MHTPQSNVLQRIKERYRVIYDLTKEACSDPEPGRVTGVLARRQEYLDAIDAEEKLLDGNQDEALDAAQEIKREIDVLIRSIQVYDKILMHVLENSRDEIAGQLRSLDSGARAARAYTSANSAYFQRAR